MMRTTAGLLYVARRSPSDTACTTNGGCVGSSVARTKKAPVAINSSLRIEKAPWGCWLAIKLSSQTMNGIEEDSRGSSEQSKCASKGIPNESQWKIERARLCMLFERSLT